jgi:hypothetical protein
MKRTTLIFVLWALLPCAAAAARLIPMGDFRLLGGQYFYNTSPSGLSGNMSFTYVPALRFSDKFTLVPTYMGSYRGTEEVTDLIGGGLRFYDQQYHFLSVKGVYTALPQLKLKLGTSYRLEYLRETRDETWGKGLFDYAKLNIGFETEYSFSKNTYARIGLDQYAIAFPNYSSLESQQATDLGRELAGKNVLNTGNTMLSVKYGTVYSGVKGELGYSSTARSYPDQPLVKSDGLLSTDKRADAYTSAALGLTYFYRIFETLALVPALDYQRVTNDSNQGHYDSNSTEHSHTPDYYDYTYTLITPALNFIIGEKAWALTVTAGMNRQDYKERLVQDTNGHYLADKIAVDEKVYGLGIVYPVARNLKLRLISNYIDSTSNMKYEKSYSYNYTTTNYLMGFNIEF